MELIWAAFLLGLVGSLHCAVMCGPLMLAVPVAGLGRSSFLTSRLTYHAGRLVTYAGIGLVFGLVGRTFALVGLQRWLSLIAGAAILIGLFLSTRRSLSAPVAALIVRLKSLFGQVLRRRSLLAQFGLGAINGLLPCGLVYIAAAGAGTTADLRLSVFHMLAFGAGTLPMLLLVGVVGPRLGFLTRSRRLIPVSVAVVAVLLVLRGLSLGIPYLSPDLAANGAVCH